MFFKQHKSQIAAIVLACFITIVLIWQPLLHQGMMATHDGENHLARFANYYLAVKQLQIPPRFAPNLLNRYGYPVFNFNYPLANIFSLPFSILQVNYEITFKLIAYLSLLGGAVGVIRWLRYFHLKNITLALSVVAYLSAPYIISAVFYRGSIGEILVYGLFPWMLWLIEWLPHTRRVLAIVIATPIVSALLLAHNVTSVLALVIASLYALVVWKWQKTTWLTATFMLMLSVGLTVWFWLPALWESGETVVFHTGIQFEYLQHLVTFQQLLFSPLTFGYSLAGPVDGLSLSIGWVSVTSVYSSVLLGMVLLILKRINIFRHYPFASRLLFLLLISLSLIFFQLTVSEPIWRLFNQLRIIQFPWRLGVFVPILLLPVWALVFQVRSKTLTVILLCGLLLQITLAVKAEPYEFFHKNNEDYEATMHSSSTQHENRAASFTFEYDKQATDWAPTPVIFSGTGSINDIQKWNGSYHRFQVTAASPLLIVEPTMNFAGWQTVIKSSLLSQQSIVLPYSSSSEIGGRIAYEIPPGEYQVITRFSQNTPSRKIGNSISVIACGVYLGFCVLFIYHYLHHDKN